MEYNLKPIGINRYRLLQNKKELPAVLFLRPQLLSQVVEEQEALRQLADATALPSVINPVIGLPDIHSGFGLPIGGVMAADAQKGGDLGRCGGDGYQLWRASFTYQFSQRNFLFR